MLEEPSGVTGSMRVKCMLNKLISDNEQSWPQQRYPEVRWMLTASTIDMRVQDVPELDILIILDERSKLFKTLDNINDSITEDRTRVCTNAANPNERTAIFNDDLDMCPHFRQLRPDSIRPLLPLPTHSAKIDRDTRLLHSQHTDRENISAAF